MKFRLKNISFKSCLTSFRTGKAFTGRSIFRWFRKCSESGAGPIPCRSSSRTSAASAARSCSTGLGTTGTAVGRPRSATDGRTTDQRRPRSGKPTWVATPPVCPTGSGRRDRSLRSLCMGPFIYHYRTRKRLTGFDNSAIWKEEWINVSTIRCIKRLLAKP